MKNLTKRSKNTGQMVTCSCFNRLRTQCGSTLPEMMFTLILVSLISIAAINGILAAYGVTGKVLDATFSDELADSLINRITGELESATSLRLEEGAEQVDGDTIAFYNSTGVPITMKVIDDAYAQKTSIADEKGHLLLHYEKYTKGNTTIPDSYWTFDNKYYEDDANSYTISSLHFTSMSERITDKPYVIKVSLVLSDGENETEYSSYAYCYNFKKDTN